MAPDHQDAPDLRGISVLRLLWCDSAGVRRVRAVPRSSIQGALDNGVGLTAACMAMPVFGDKVADGSGLSPVGEVRLTPDGSTFVRLPWCNGHAMALCDMLTSPGGAPWECCPRSALKRVLEQLKERHNLEVRVGFEIEFMLLKRTTTAAASAPQTPAPSAPIVPIGGAAAVPGGAAAAAAAAAAAMAATPMPRLGYPGENLGLEPVDDSIYGQASSFDSYCDVLDTMISTLERMGIPVQQYHPESAPGQFEVAIGCCGALEAADRLLLAREAIAGVARKAGYEVTMAPKPIVNHAGNGCHCHVSLWRDGQSVMADAEQPPRRQASSASGAASANTQARAPVLSKDANAFLAGALRHLPGLLPLTAPSVNSYSRLQRSCWCGAYAVWGWDNREAPIRLTFPPGARQYENTNAEFKAFDGSTNPYIGIAGIVIAGMLGLEEDAALPPPLQADPATLPTAQQPVTLPGSLYDALAKLLADAPLQKALATGLGKPLITAFLAVRRCEAMHGGDRVGEILLKY